MNYTGLFRKPETQYFFVIGFILVFLALSFDLNMAVIYVIILSVDQWLQKNDKNISFKYSNGSVKTSLVSAVIGLASFLGISTILLQFFPSTMSAVQSQIQSIFNLLATATPILKDSKILTFIGWGILIPVIETNFFFGSLLEGLPEILGEAAGMQNAARELTSPNVPFLKKLKNPEILFFILLIAAFFALFHLSAKGVQSIPLLITFIFAVISCLLVIKDRERRGAIFLHVAMNSLTVLTTYGLLS
jgi:hypothetical protein